MTPRERDRNSLWIWFAVSSVVFVSVLAISPVKDYLREYRAYFHDYRELLLAKAGTAKELQQARSETLRVRQIWIPEFGNRVDRCITCHLGTENASMQDAPEPFRTHPQTPHTHGDFPRFGCVSCHRGQGPATTVQDAHGNVRDWDSPLLPLEYTEASCGTCHRGDEVPQASLLSAGRALMEEVGCYGCHQLEGHEDWESPAPDLDGLSQKTSPGWLAAWLRSPRSLRQGTWMPDFQLPEDEVADLVAFLWAQPPGSTRTVDLREELPEGDPDRGRKAFRAARCISCHTVDGRGHGSAPELGGIGSAVNRHWLMAFLEDPHRFQPSTLMPRYNLDGQTLLDITQYLIEDLFDPAAPEPGPPLRPARQAVQRGEQLYRNYGCAGCHRIAGRDEIAQAGPELTGIGGKPMGVLDFGARTDLPRHLPDWLAAKVWQPRTFREGLKMPQFHFTAQQVQALVTALLSETAEPIPPALLVESPSPSYRPPGRFGRLMTDYRCLSCHQVEGFGGDLSTAPLTFEGSRVKQDWLEDYLLRPRTIRPILTERMIPLGLPQEEAAFMAQFMGNVYVDNDIPGEIFADGPPPDQVQRGRDLFFERYGCQACHQVEGKGGYYGPLLDEAGNRLHSGWILWWLQGPQRWRPDVRCPDYGLDEPDARDLAAYLSTLLGSESAGGGA